MCFGLGPLLRCASFCTQGEHSKTADVTAPGHGQGCYPRCERKKQREHGRGKARRAAGESGESKR